MRAITASAAGCALALGLAACSSTDSETEATATNSGGIAEVTVVQSETLAPDIEFEPGLDYLEEEIQVLWEGEGDPLQDGQPLLLDIYGESLVDGTVIMNTFDGLPESFMMAPEIVGDGIYEALQSVRIGGRVLVVSPPGQGSDEHEPLALVVDVLPIEAEGEEQTPVAGMPSVQFDSSRKPKVEVPAGREPKADLEVATLIYGGGTQVRSDSTMLLNYAIVHHDDSPADDQAGLEVGDEWKAGEIYDTSWEPQREPLTLKMDEVTAVPGLQQGLLDQTARSRVLMVVPPELGYPERGTTIMVVDILDVWNPEEL